MILKTAANYNDEGGYIEAWKNSDGTTGVKLIPKSGGDEGKQGLKSISISPAITTTPALDSLAPIYYDDLTEEQKQNGIVFNVNTDEQSTDFVLTITPTSEWHGYDYSGEESVRLDNGVPMTISGNTDSETPFEIYGDDNDEKIISVTIRFNAEG